MNRKLTVSLIIALLALALAVLALASVIIFNEINFSNFNTIQTPQQTPQSTPQQTPASQEPITGTPSQLIKPIVNPTPIPVSASSGTILASSDIGVYSDSACTINLNSINWGSVAAGGSVTQIVYVKNTGTSTMTLSLAVSNWSPTTASTYITISWNQTETQLSAGQSVPAAITLTVSPSITGVTTFSNTIAISGTE
jgi:hypothetical protein